jgi:hypothetical protein
MNQENILCWDLNRLFSYYRTDLIPKFKVVATLKCDAPPTFMNVDKPNAIVRAIKIMQYPRFIIVLMLSTDDDNKLANCVLRPSYSRIFDDNVISEVNAEKCKLKLIHKKKVADPCVTYRTLYSSSIVCQIKEPFKIPIVFCDGNFHPTFGFMVTVILGLSGENVAVCPLPAAYSQAFTDQDIADVYSEIGKYRLIYKTKHNSNQYFFEIVE